MFTICLILYSLFSVGQQVTAPIQDSIPESPDAVKSEVKYQFSDSSRFDADSMIFHLYGKAAIQYEKTILKAEYIQIHFRQQIITAMPLADSAGILQGFPFFQDGDKTFTCRQIRYNFKTRKGILTALVTQEGDGYIHGEKVKREANEEILVSRARYTTCTDTLHPHFYIEASRLKIIPGQQIICGPAQLYMADVPTPAVIPFGFFPVKKGQTRGFLFPGYGNDAQRGFFLRGLGYYFPVNDYMDLTLKGDVFFNGSFAATLAQQYAMKYRFQGNYSFTYSRNIFGDPKVQDEGSIQPSYEFRWLHSLDPKRLPGSTFSANIHLLSATFFQNNARTNYQDLTRNQFASSVLYSTSLWKNKASLSAALRHNQNNQTRMVNLTLPQVTFNVSSFSPFTALNKSGRPQWYENIRIGYQLNVQNQINLPDSLLISSAALDSAKNGISHDIPINLPTIKILKYFTLSPSVGYREWWYSETKAYFWDKASRQAISYSKKGFFRTYQYQTSASLATRIYGQVEFKKGMVKAIRHVITPTLSVQYTPDFSADKFGFYDYYRKDSSAFYPQKYARFEGSLNGGPGSGKSGLVQWSINNNIEMKYISPNDTARTVKKQSLMDNLTLGGSYNFLADSFQFSPVFVNGSTRILKRVSANFSASLQPYLSDGQRYVNKLRIESNLWKPLELSQIQIAMNTGFNSTEFRKKQDSTRKNIYFRPDWSVNFQYVFGMTRSADQSVYINHTLQAGGELQLTPTWKAVFNLAYDIRNKQLVNSSIDFRKDLHCWEMEFNWVPVGLYRRYLFTLRIKSPVLKDVKLNRRRDFY